MKTIELKKKKEASTADDAITKSVERLLSFDARTMGQKITVKTMGGKVFLGGVVDGYFAKLAADELALMPAGAWKVVNRMRVKPLEKADDNELAAILRKMVAADLLLRQYPFMIAVRGGTVSVDGKVPNNFIKLRATNLISRVLGVDDVNNNIDVTESSGSVSVEAVQRMFKMDALLDSGKLSLRMEKDNLVIGGEVENYTQLQLAVADAFRAGAKRVKSEIKIKGSEEHSGEDFKTREYFFWPFGI